MSSVETGDKSGVSNEVLIEISHFTQKATWDCGISCIMMVLNSSLRTEFLENYSQICEKEGIGKSTWSIDLAYLLHRFGINHVYYTVTVGIDPLYSSEVFYKTVFEKDYNRIVERFKDSSLNGVNIEKRSVTIDEIVLHLSQNGLIIVLVNANLLVCDRCLQGGFALRACLPCAPPSYQGHYIVLVGYNYSSMTIFYRNPSLKDKMCSLPFSALDKARFSFGTDEDIIFVYSGMYRYE